MAGYLDPADTTNDGICDRLVEILAWTTYEQSRGVKLSHQVVTSPGTGLLVNHTHSYLVN